MAARTMGRGKITQLDLRRIKAEYFKGLDPAQIGLFLFNERKPQRWTLLIEKVLSEAKLRKRRPATGGAAMNRPSPE
jgi:hypothetical protein